MQFTDATWLALRAITAWIQLVQSGSGAQDAKQATIDEALRAADPVRALLAVLDPAIAADDTLVTEVAAQIKENA